VYNKPLPDGGFKKHKIPFLYRQHQGKQRKAYDTHDTTCFFKGNKNNEEAQNKSDCFGQSVAHIGSFIDENVYT
jgi:hypothetical protein